MNSVNRSGASNIFFAAFPNDFRVVAPLKGAEIKAPENKNLTRAAEPVINRASLINALYEIRTYKKTKYLRYTKIRDRYDLTLIFRQVQSIIGWRLFQA